ncbi:NUDIX domain-containing protein [Polymorphobacter fuscus]|uniref:NUDIX domain-containing protein n=1 Tax=Sandarakinorhabdus fusca TaxID=1439888 RepID=A0A7C9GV83_9SPHN|nr:NUDIX hydrolase [Polymorphobacter fuscus]KAB7646140.1 NUDIX domain-containing protein [Polymorphobacter fuscus]MQT17338.1 NUDIX domain-containing protein [Polymorphobacter fuscus]NJC10129.1 8-oxo-dGTP diphosphatase [Polymorphobacter fuscus]
MRWDGADFGGAKLAALHDGGLLAYRRDDRPELPFPGMIDLPGGGREGDESPEDCALRELAEEFGIVVPSARIHYRRAYLLGDGATVSHFLAVRLTAEEVASVQFGDEGQDWALMPVADFIDDAEAVPRLREWLRHYLAADETVRYLDTTSKNPGNA